MNKYLLPIALFGSIALVSHIKPAAALSPVEIQRIAKQTTIQIGECDSVGSGVIIRKNGNTYTVLTVAHNFEQRGCQMVAPDDIKYPMTQIKLFPNKVDLAVFTFTSNKNYPVAKLIDNSDRVEAGETIYVAGFPFSSGIKTSVFTFVKGDVVSNSSIKQQDKGYSLIYSNNTLPGHSGGPVWNDKGELIAIHGQGDVDTKSQETINDGVRYKTGYNLGITVNTFTKLAAAAGVSGYAPVLVAAKPKPVDDLIASAFLKISKGDYRGTLADMDRAISLAPQNSRAYSLRGAAKSGLGDKQGAMMDHNRAIILNPNDARSYNNRGNNKSALGDEKAAIEDYNRAISLNPNFAEAYNGRGAAKSASGDKKGSIDDYNLAISLNPNLAIAYNNRGNNKSDLGDKKGAIDDYNRAISLNPNLAIAYNNLGNSKSNLGDKKGAIDDYDRAISLNPNYTIAYNNRGIAKSKLGDKQGAIDDYNRAISLNPNGAKDSYNARGNVKLDLGDKQGAIDDYNWAISLNPKYAQAYYNRGVAKSKLGDKKGAIDDYNRAISLNPNLAIAYNNRGFTKSKLGDKQGAISDWRKAAELYQKQGRTDDYKRVMKAIEKGKPEDIQLPDDRGF